MDNKILSIILEKPRILLLFGIILISGSLPFAIKLYANLHSGIEELLPKSAPRIRSLDILRTRLGDNLQLTVLISGASSDQLHTFADRLAKESETIPAPNKPRFVDFRPSVIHDFFQYRKMLFISQEELQNARKAVHQKIAKSDIFSLGLDDDEEDKGPIIDLDELIKKYEQEANKIPYFPTGYYENEQKNAIVMVFYPTNGVTGYEGSSNFKTAISKKINEVANLEKQPHLKVEFSGDVESIIQEQKSLESDILYSTTGVILFESLLIFIFFRWIPSIVTLGLPLIAGVLLTFAISYFAVGSVNLTTAFLGSIIIGNGVNAGIILLARFIEERRNEHQGNEAMRIAVKETWRFTLAASGAAALAYGSLMVTAFRGYSQFGFIGGIGMLLCWAATYIFSPPLGILLDKLWPVKAHRKTSHLFDLVFGKLADFTITFWKPILKISLVVSLLALFVFANFIKDPFEYDTTKLRSNAAKLDGGYLEVDSRAEGILRHNILPMVVLVKNINEVPQIYDSYKNNINPKSIIDQILTMQALVPENQKEKINILQNIVDEVPTKKLAHLKGKTKSYFNDVKEASKLSPFTLSDLPEVLRRQFREIDGSEGKLVLLFPKYGTDTKDGRIVLNFAKEVRAVKLPPGAVVAGSHLVFADMLAAISHDGPIATILSFLAVLLLSIWLTRGGINGSFVLMLSLLVGVLWTIALASIFHMKINFLNFIALPITFGVGLDYAINVYGRFHHSDHSHKALKLAVSRSGSAVTVCSGTTIIGYGSLLLSKNGALFSFGMMAILGEIACLVAALIILPAMLSRKIY
jgi:predicted RND superfamily exporter protein